MLLLTEHSHYGKGEGKDRGYTGYPGDQKSDDEMESKESEEEESEDKSFMGKLKSFFGRGKKKDDDTNRIVGIGTPTLDFVIADAD